MNQIEVKTTVSAFDDPLWDHFLSYYHYPSLAVADEVGLFSFLAHKPSPTEEVAEHFSLGARPVEILLSLIASLGFLELREGAWHLNELALTYLTPASPFYWGSAFYERDSELQRVIKECLKKDTEQGTPQANLSTLWKSGAQDAQKVREFVHSMNRLSLAPAMRLAQTWDLRNTEVLLDVGGGSGVFSISFAKRNPHLRCKVLELPAVCAWTEEYINRAGVSSQVTVHPCDIFSDPLPEGADIVFFSNFFHDWGLQDCSLFTRKSFDALRANGRIALHEMVLGDDKLGPLTVASFSMAMLVQTQGRQYSFQEYESLFSAAGFTDSRIRSLSKYFSLVTAIKP